MDEDRKIVVVAGGKNFRINNVEFIGEDSDKFGTLIRDDKFVYLFPWASLEMLKVPQDYKNKEKEKV